jgi:hypothetical protein
VELGGDRAEAGQQVDHRERHAEPQLHQDDRGERVLRVGQPIVRVALQVQGVQHRVDHPAPVEQPLEHLRGHDDRDRVGDEEQRAEDARPGEPARVEERQRHRDHELDGDRDDGVEDRVHDRALEDAVVEDRVVVLGADPLDRSADEVAQLAVLERHQDVERHRVDEQRAEEQHDGRDEQVRHRRVARAAQANRDGAALAAPPGPFPYCQAGGHRGERSEAPSRSGAMA